jgi:hypothetical protein
MSEYCLMFRQNRRIKPRNAFDSKIFDTYCVESRYPIAYTNVYESLTYLLSVISSVLFVRVKFTTLTSTRKKEKQYLERETSERSRAS